MSRTFQEPGNRRDREALYRRNAKLQRERDRFPFSYFNPRLFVERQRFDAWLDSLPRDAAGEPIIH
jgi:hypothetical protein